jgi:D-alanyl-D-alanine carboxypeptidase
MNLSISKLPATLLGLVLALAAGGNSAFAQAKASQTNQAAPVAATAQQAQQPPEIAARQYLLLDLASNQVLAERDADAQAEPRFADQADDGLHRVQRDTRQET